MSKNWTAEAKKSLRWLRVAQEFQENKRHKSFKIVRSMHQTRCKMFSSAKNNGWVIGRIEAKANAQTGFHCGCSVFPKSIVRIIFNETINGANFQSVQTTSPLSSGHNHEFARSFWKFNSHAVRTIHWQICAAIISRYSPIYPTVTFPSIKSNTKPSTSTTNTLDTFPWFVCWCEDSSHFPISTQYRACFHPKFLPLMRMKEIFTFAFLFLEISEL